MRPDFGTDSLDQIELVMALEEKGVVLDEQLDLTDLEPDQLTLLVEIACPPYEAGLRAPEAQEGWPSTVRVLGERDRIVLFAIDLPHRVGVGRRSASGVVEDARIYRSLQRALFAF